MNRYRLSFLAAVARAMRAAAVALLVLAAPVARAVPTTLAIPDDNWSVVFDLPDLLRVAQDNSGGRFTYRAMADRWTLSLDLDKPGCPGEHDLQAHLKCFAPSVKLLPGLVRESLRVTQFAQGFQVTFMTFSTGVSGPIKTLHTHMLFVLGRRWGDLHVICTNPSEEEIRALVLLGSTFHLVRTDDPAG